jgi:outer membrane receptor for ferrienterochelin and colicins
MKRKFLLAKKELLLLLALFISSTALAQTTLTGSVRDAEDGQALVGANIIIAGTTVGTTTDGNGNFSLTTERSFPLTLRVSYIGYKTREVPLSSAQSTLTIRLDPDIMLENIIVSASRRPEKIQEAPASVSIVSAQTLANDAVGNPFLSLRNLVGVDVGQAGINSGFITLRGSSQVFQTETFVMADYRNLVLPGLGTLGYGQQPIDPIDLARVEVVRGPGSALYGPGVEAGVVHFISKDPFQYPGTSVSIGAGNRNAFETAIRHAGTTKSNKLGYKVFGFYRTARDWELDPNDQVDAAHLATFQDEIRSSVNPDVTYFTTIPDYYTESISLTGTLEYRPTDKTSITGVGGWSMGKFIFRTAQGEGYSKAPRPFGQVRLQSGGLFAQAFWSYFDGRDGNQGLYTTGLTTITKSHQFESQLQYNFMTLNDKLDITAGADYRLNTVDTERSVHGRYEDDDDFLIYGAYVQGDARLSDKLNLIAAGRVDRFTALDATSFSPRLGLVFKANANNTFRITYNRAVGAPTSINLYADLALQEAAAYKIHLLGGAQPITFNEMQGSGFVPGLTVYNGTNLALMPVYAVTTAGIAQSGAFPQSLVDYLQSLTPQITGSSAGVMNMAPRSRDKLKLSESNMFEVGYKGIFANKLSVIVDVYHNRRNNMLSAPMPASPLLVQPTLGADLGAFVAATADPAVLAQYGLTPEALGAIYAGVAQQRIALDANGNLQPLGVVRSDQTNPDSSKPTIDITYYNLSEIRYTGVDFGLDYSFTKNLMAFASVSWLSQNMFRDVPVGEEDNSPTVDFSLNVPDTKFKVGMQFQPETGFNANVAVRYQNAWEAINGAPFSGPVDAFTLVDLGAGYRFVGGLALSATVTNLFNEEYRFIYGAPKIGRQIATRATYTFGGRR